MRVAVLGTYDMAERSWMWGWANPGLRDTGAVALTGAVERYGRTHGIAELAAATLHLSSFADPRRAAEMLAFTGMGSEHRGEGAALTPRTRRQGRCQWPPLRFEQ